MPVRLREFQEKVREFREKARAGMVAFRRERRNGKNVGQFGLLGNYYDAVFFAFRAPIGTLKKNTTGHSWEKKTPIVFEIRANKCTRTLRTLFTVLANLLFEKKVD